MPRWEKRTVEERFWGKVARDDSPGACWLWTAGRNAAGYGMFCPSDQSMLAHRYAWFLAHGEVPALQVLHACDVPNCVRPSHLFLGTPKDNSDDKIKKGRQARGERVWHRRRVYCQHGERNGMAKLTREQAQEILRRAQVGEESQRTIAASFGVGQDVVSRILSGKRWPELQKVG